MLPIQHLTSIFQYPFNYYQPYLQYQLMMNVQNPINYYSWQPQQYPSQFIGLEGCHSTTLIQSNTNTQELQNNSDRNKNEPVEITKKKCTSLRSPQAKKIIKRVSKQRKHKLKRKNQRRNYNIGHWTKKEHRLYLNFVDQNQEIMSNSDLKKQEKIFKQMSLVIRSRSPSQCRSHHQKFNPNELFNAPSQTMASNSPLIKMEE